MGKKSSSPPRPIKSGQAVSPKIATPPASHAFSIVGLGASAGRLEALEQFLGHVPAGSGLTFVIVQHLDPSRKGILPKLLQRTTKMKVFQVKDRTRVRASRSGRTN